MGTLELVRYLNENTSLKCSIYTKELPNSVVLVMSSGM